MENVICFGQQPCGFFPKRFLKAKVDTAKRLQREIGGRVVFFYHDSDADYRETITILRDRQSGAEVRLNFTQENKIQKKFSPLYAKRVPKGWKEEILKQLPRFITFPSSPGQERMSRASGASRETGEVETLGHLISNSFPQGEEGKNSNLMDIFRSTDEKSVAGFCLEMYRKMGLLDGVEVERSSDKNFRERAIELEAGYFADVEYQNEIVRAQLIGGKLQLHEGGGKYITLPEQKIEKWQKNPGREQRMEWMQSVINCTHYIYGEGEKQYLDISAYSGIQFIDRDKIDEPSYAWLG